MNVFLPCLILGVLCVVLWAHAYGIPDMRVRQARALLRRRGFCPDCGLPTPRCHCFTDDGVL